MMHSRSCARQDEGHADCVAFVCRPQMTYVQATQGGGGWPMNVFLTPELQPFIGGTYWPPKDAYGRPGGRLPEWPGVAVAKLLTIALPQGLCFAAVVLLWLLCAQCITWGLSHTKSFRLYS